MEEKKNLTLYKSASSEVQCLFWSALLGSMNKKTFMARFPAGEKNDKTYFLLLHYVSTLGLYNIAVYKGDTLKKRDSNQHHRLKVPNPDNHMPTLVTILDGGKGSSKPFPVGHFKGDAFIRIQFLQNADTEFFQYLQRKYTEISVNIFHFLQSYLKFASFDWVLSYYGTSLAQGDISFADIRRTANIGRPHIFLFFRVYKQLKKEISRYHEKNPSRFVVGLLQSPLPIFFWNCGKGYTFDFRFKTVEKSRSTIFASFDQTFYQDKADFDLYYWDLSGML